MSTVKRYILSLHWLTDSSKRKPKNVILFSGSTGLSSSLNGKLINSFSLMNLGFARSLAKELTDGGIKAFLLSPKCLHRRLKTSVSFQHSQSTDTWLAA